jgi:hypothetical protein
MARVPTEVSHIARETYEPKIRSASVASSKRCRAALQGSNPCGARNEIDGKWVMCATRSLLHTGALACTDSTLVPESSPLRRAHIYQPFGGSTFAPVSSRAICAPWPHRQFIGSRRVASRFEHVDNRRIRLPNSLPKNELVGPGVIVLDKVRSTAQDAGRRPATPCLPKANLIQCANLDEGAAP